MYIYDSLSSIVLEVVLMAERIEPYHVPQQSRREKLRVLNHHPVCVDLAPLYDPSLISSDLINSAANLHRQNLNLGSVVKEEGVNFMGFVGGIHMITAPETSSSSSRNHMFLDPQLNPSSIQDINGGPCLYTAANGQSLNLSLSSHQTHQNNLPLELNLERYDCSSMFSNHFNSIGLFRNSAGVLGPFAGYVSVLKDSRFLKPAKELLEELFDVGKEIFSEKNSSDDSCLFDHSPPPLESLSECDGSEQTRKKSRLLSMLDEVYKRYKQYYQQMQTVIASFECVSELSIAAPLAYLALKAMSKHFRCLKDTITDQLQFTTKFHDKTNYERDETRKVENSIRVVHSQIRPFHSTGYNDQPVWRPQRGLPDRAVTVLRAWLFEHFLHPYPTDTDKLMLAKKTGLSRNQVSNWFINARVRLWKPMVEEIHMLETRQGQKASQRDEQPPNNPNNHKNSSNSIQKIEDFPLKHNREGLTEAEGQSTNLPYNNFSHHHDLSVDVSNAAAGGGGDGDGVSLTLGLHQNSLGLVESYQINAAHRFGLHEHGEGEYLVSGYSEQNREFGRDIMGGQLLHDFVG